MHRPRLLFYKPMVLNLWLAANLQLYNLLLKSPLKERPNQPVNQNFLFHADFSLAHALSLFTFLFLVYTNLLFSSCLCFTHGVRPLATRVTSLKLCSSFCGATGMTSLKFCSSLYGVTGVTLLKFCSSCMEWLGCPCLNFGLVFMEQLGWPHSNFVLVYMEQLGWPFPSFVLVFYGATGVTSLKFFSTFLRNNWGDLAQILFYLLLSDWEDPT